MFRTRVSGEHDITKAGVVVTHANVRVKCVRVNAGKGGKTWCGNHGITLHSCMTAQPDCTGINLGHYFMLQKYKYNRKNNP